MVARTLAGGSTVHDVAAHLVHLDTTTIAVLRQHRLAQRRDRLALGPRWVDQDLVFAPGCTTCVTPG